MANPNSYSNQYGRMSRGVILPRARTNMTKSFITLALAGLTGYGLWMLMKPKVEFVTGKSGKPWRVVLLGTTGDTREYEVFAPAGSWGPHAELSVIRYSQTGSNMASRKLIAVGAPVPAEITAGATSDFVTPAPTGVMAMGTSR